MLSADATHQRPGNSGSDIADHAGSAPRPESPFGLVLKQDLVDVEDLKLAITESVGCSNYVREKFGEFRFVVGRYRFTCLPTI